MRILQLLPHSLSLRLGAFSGGLLWIFTKRKVDRAEARCVAALGVGVSIARKIVRDSYRNMGRSAAEFARLEQIIPELDSFVTVNGMENLEKALARNCGVLLMTAHIGNWELAGTYLAAKGYSLSPIYTPQRNKRGIEDIISHQRIDTAGLNIVPSKGFGLREAFRAVRGGGILAFLQDLDARQDGMIVPFLGLPASTATGIIKMYQKLKAPVIAAVTLRQSSGKNHVITISEIISDLYDEDGNPFGVSMEKSLKMCNNILGNWVRENPEQWMWLLDRWGFTMKPPAEVSCDLRN